MTRSARELPDAWQSAVDSAGHDYPRTFDEAALAEHAARAIENGALAAHSADVVLAWAVVRGDTQALAKFDRLVADDIVTAARKVDRAPAFVDEVRQAVRIRLVVGEGDAAPRLATYRGHGSLRAWVAIAALRVALNLRRDAPVSGDVLQDVVDREPDPELKHLKTLYRSEYREALTEAITSLPDRQRALLRMRFVTGLELAQIGKLYRVHESTASRWIAAALEAVGTTTRERLVARLHVGAGTADSIARMVASGLDLSIARLL